MEHTEFSPEIAKLLAEDGKIVTKMHVFHNFELHVLYF